MDNQISDPLSEEFFRPLLIAERVANILFIASAILSIVVLLVTNSTNQELGNAIEVAFLTSVIALFFLNLAIRLYFSPRAQQGRLRDFLSHAYRTTAQITQSSGYYNNSATTPLSRIAAQTLESAYFTKFIARKMCSATRALVAIYALTFVVLALNRSTNLAAISIAAQIVFSEQILSRWLRMEWLRSKSEVIFDQIVTNFQNKRTNNFTSVELFVWYEILKATASISLSSATFKLHATRLTNEWETIRQRLGI